MNKLPSDIQELAFSYRRKVYSFSEWPKLHEDLLKSENILKAYIEFLNKNCKEISKLSDELKAGFMFLLVYLKMDFALKWHRYNGADAMKELRLFYNKDIFQWNNLIDPQL